MRRRASRRFAASVTKCQRGWWLHELRAYRAGGRRSGTTELEVCLAEEMIQGLTWNGEAGGHERSVGRERERESKQIERLVSETNVKVNIYWHIGMPCEF